MRTLSTGARGLDRAAASRWSSPSSVDVDALREPGHERAIDAPPRGSGAFDDLAVDGRLEPVGQRVVARVVRVVADRRVRGRVQRVLRDLDERVQLVALRRGPTARAARSGRRPRRTSLRRRGTRGLSAPTRLGRPGAAVPVVGRRLQRRVEHAGAVDDDEGAVLDVGRVLRRANFCSTIETAMKTGIISRPMRNALLRTSVVNSDTATIRVFA